MGLTPRSAAAVVSEWRTTHRHPGDLPGGQSEPDTREAHPRSRVHFQSRTLPQVMVHSFCHA